MVMSPFGQNCTSGKILPDGNSFSFMVFPLHKFNDLYINIGKRLACGYQDGSVKIVDLKLGAVVKDIKLNGDVTGITCLDAHKDNNLIICGCEDGCILLLSIQSGKVCILFFEFLNFFKI